MIASCSQCDLILSDCRCTEYPPMEEMDLAAIDQGARKCSFAHPSDVVKLVAEVRKLRKKLAAAKEIVKTIRETMDQ